MRTVTFWQEGALTFGLVTPRGVLDVGKASRQLDGSLDVPRSTLKLIAQGAGGKEKLQRLLEAASTLDNSYFMEEGDLQFGPCLPNPPKILCIGLNYREHAQEARMEIPAEPIVFSKFNNALSGHGQTVALPSVGKKFDYEAELAIVIGRPGRNIPPEEALDYVYGYCCANDLSARDLQFKSSQWLLGKTCDGFCPLGPELVSADEIADPNSLAIRSYVNGELRQDATTADMIFSCRELISYVSRHMTLEPGDLILTGTPSGVIAGYPREKRIWLKAGDQMTVEIEGLGRLTTLLGEPQ